MSFIISVISVQNKFKKTLSGKNGGSLFGRRDFFLFIQYLCFNAFVIVPESFSEESDAADMPRRFRNDHFDGNFGMMVEIDVPDCDRSKKQPVEIGTVFINGNNFHSAVLREVLIPPCRRKSAGTVKKLSRRRPKSQFHIIDVKINIGRIIFEDARRFAGKFP